MESYVVSRVIFSLWVFSLLLSYFRYLALIWFTLGKSIVGDLLYVMNHAVEQPLDVHFGFSSQRKSVQALVRPDIAKDGLRHPDTLRVDLTPLGGVNLRHHPP